MNVNYFNTKKILILGATQFQLPAIRVAQSLGLKVIVADNVPSNIGHLIGDFSENISTIDLDGLVKIAKKYRIDGVMTYGSDVSALGASYVAEQLGLPGNPYLSTKILQRKDEFRKFQEKADLPHPRFMVFDEQLDKEIFIGEKLAFPILVKPVDSSGSKGQTIIYSSDELKTAFVEAKKFSRCGVVICEEFLNSEMLELDGDILIQNGELSFGQYGHNYFLKGNKWKVPIGEIMPGFFDQAIINQIDSQLQTIISEFQLRAGCLNFDALFVNNSVYILDIGLRNGGNYVPELIKMSTGVDLTEAAIYCALGVNYPIDKIHVDNPKPVMTYILNSTVPGLFSGFRFHPEIVKYIKKSVSFVEFESEVKPFNRGDHALGVVFIEFKTIGEMKSKWQTIEEMVAIDIIQKSEIYEPKENTFKYKRYKELISPFLQQKINEAEVQGKKDIIRVLNNQFVFNNKEQEITDNVTVKHYDAAAEFTFEGKNLFGVERLYKRQIAVNITLKCIAHCRHCLRRNYDPFILSEDDLHNIARFIGQSEIVQDVREVLITGGDPFLVPKKLFFILKEIESHSPMIETVRIASRLPIHQPDWINENILSILKRKFPFRIELATQINNSVELFPEVKEAFLKLHENVSAIYNQTVLLRGINNSENELINLFDDLRSLGIENHYLFHCVPINGLEWLRTSLDETIELANKISSSGLISGRSKPQVAVMTDIGKITLYEGSIMTRNSEWVKFQSNYYLADRLKWNPFWKLPASAEVMDDGRLSVWYQDKQKNI